MPIANNFSKNHKQFQKSMKIAFNEVRTEVSNLNSFVQERLTGMMQDTIQCKSTSKQLLKKLRK